MPHIIMERKQPPPALPPRKFFVAGLDLGKLSDFSALALLEWEVPHHIPSTWKADYSCSMLHRWQLGTPYTDVVKDVVKLVQSPALAAARPVLAIDATGCGEPVVEAVVQQLAAAGTSRHVWAAVTITGGNAATWRGPGRWNVAKKQLVSHLQVVMGGRRLHVSPDLDFARLLLRELETFSVKITDAGNESFEAWRERDHDDLVLAVALAVFGAERGWAYEEQDEESEARIDIIRT
jgi:hypothetical protein